MIRMFPLLPIPCSTALIMTQLKLGSRKQASGKSNYSGRGIPVYKNNATCENATAEK